MALLVSAAVALAGSPAFAEPGAVPASTPPVVDDDKIEMAALAMTLVGIGGSLGLFMLHESKEEAWDESLGGSLVFGAGAVGLVVAPSIGQVYGRNYWGALAGTALRSTGYTIVFYGMVSEILNPSLRNDLLIVGGVGMIVGGTLYSVIDGPLSVRRHNRRQRASSSRVPLVTPGLVVGPGGSTGTGLHLGFSF